MVSEQGDQSNLGLSEAGHFTPEPENVSGSDYDNTLQALLGHGDISQ